jgi:acetyl esterase/lipase
MTPRLLAAAVLAVSCSDDASDDAGPAVAEPALARGDLLSLTPLGSFDANEVADYVAGFDIDASGLQFGVDAYRVEYRTIDPGGVLVRASSLFALPNNGEPVLEQAVWMHGTTVFRGEAASVNEESSDRAAAFFFAAAGYATTAPDYLGLGLGEGPHPYDHIPSEVTAGIDALRASHQTTLQLGRGLGPTLSLSGHSQGGPAAVALAHEVQDGGADGLALGSVAPISGPYDMTASLAIASQGGIAFAAPYLGYLTVAWNRWLGLYATPSEAFLPPYDQTVETLFDNTHTTEEVFSGLPETLEELFTPDFLQRLREPSGALREALEQASRVCAWDPQGQVTVFASSADADVPIENARHCVESFRDNGADVPLVDLGDADHSESMTQSLPMVLDGFVSARPPRR